MTQTTTEGLRLLRKAAETYSQAEIARALGVCQQTVSAYLRGDARPTRDAVRLRAQAAFKIPSDAWLTPEERDAAKAIVRKVTALPLRARGAPVTRSSVRRA